MARAILKIAQVEMTSFPYGNPSGDRYAEDRRLMIEHQIRKRGVTDERVLSAMASVPRHEFVPPFWTNQAYADEPLPIGHGQTISQPYIVAAMVAALALAGPENVLEIGTGCGYQAAVLSLLAREVHTLELLPDLAQSAGERVQRLGYANVHVHAGDGTLGWLAYSPYNAILIAAAAPSIPEPLLQQLAEDGRLIAPVGDLDKQELHVIIRHEGKLVLRSGGPCRFVPLLGEYGWRK
jgi:protein-L-isoaspartate(D-aspartate) O-methyltransferase